jgi:hypothetical protein
MSKFHYIKMQENDRKKSVRIKTAIFLPFCGLNEGLNRQGATVYLPYYWHITSDISNILFLV